MVQGKDNFKECEMYKSWKSLYKGFVEVFKSSTSGHEVVKATDSVAMLVHIADTDEIILIEQCREAMSEPLNQHGVIVEVPAGRFDVSLSPGDLVIKEAQEEIGATIGPKHLTLLNDAKMLALSPGVLTEKQMLAYVRINLQDIEQVDRVFGVDPGENITRKRVPISELPGMVFYDMKTFALVQWFLNKLRAEGRQF